jgi:hypothetical protein
MNLFYMLETHREMQLQFGIDCKKCTKDGHRKISVQAYETNTTIVFTIENACKLATEMN